MPKPDIRYRAAEREDAPVLAAIELSTAPEFATFLLDGLIQGRSAGGVLSAIYARDTVDSWRWSWIAELGGAPVGAIGAYPVCLIEASNDTGEAARRMAQFKPIKQCMRPDAFHIARLGVLDGHRRLGIARGLIEVALSAAGKHDETLVTLFAWQDNVPALALYDSLGFTELARVHIEAHPRLTRSGTTLMLGRALE